MTSTPIVEVRNLSVSFGPRRAPRTVLRDVSLAVHAGECLALVGESGSGKSVTARTLVGLTGPQAHLRADAVSFRGEDTRGWGECEWKSVRGRHIGFVLQDALLETLDSPPEGPGPRPFFWGRDPDDPVIHDGAIAYTDHWVQEHTRLTARTYPGILHAVSPEMGRDVKIFLEHALAS